MNQIKKIAALLLALVMLLSFAGCVKQVKELTMKEKLCGAWRDTTGILSCEFKSDDTVVLHLVNFTIPVLGQKVKADVNGTYVLTQQEDDTWHMNVNYKIPLLLVETEVSQEFAVELEDDTLRLKDVKYNTTYTLTRYDPAAETTSEITTTDAQ